MTDNLIVPINLEALCIGAVDSSKNSFVKKDADFSHLPYEDDQGKLIPSGGRANISEYVLSKAWIDDGTNLEQGIHLHWSLPSLLTQGNQGKDKLEFPAVPDRWLVMRIPFDNNNSPLTTKSWIIESNALSLNSDSAGNAISVPYSDGDTGYGFTGQPFCYLGQVFNDVQSWVEQGDKNQYKLTALGYGNVNFASSYQNCRSVFGFHDDASDMLQQTHTCTYLVAGWYGKAGDDILRTIPVGSTLTDWLLENNLQIANQQLINVAGSNSLYSGFVRSVAWNPSNEYLNDPPLETTISMANNSIEALSAFIASTAANSRSVESLNQQGLEEVLNALQLNLLNINQNTQTLDTQKLDKDLHRKRFSSHDSGLIWTIVQRTDDNAKQVTLPSELADPLNDLNVLQEKFNSINFTINSLRSQIFVDWCKYMKHSYPLPPQADTQSIQDFINQEISQSDSDNLESLVTVQNKLRWQISTNSNSLSQLLSSVSAALQLKTIAAPRYYSPLDPAILLTSNASWNYAGERNIPASGKLLQCRTSSQIITNGNVSPYFTNLPFNDDVHNLIAESITLTQNPSVSGIQPESLAMNLWQGTPWLPLSLEWEAYYSPIQRDTNYKQNHISSNFSFNADCSELVFNSGVTFIPLPETYEGSMILTPGVKFNLTKRIQDYLSNHPNDPNVPQLQAILNSLHTIPILAQTLDGFNNLLLMSKKRMQLNVYDPFADGDTFSIQNVKNAVLNMNTSSPLLDTTRILFNPIQDGMVGINRLRIIDAFGRYKVIDTSKIIFPSATITKDRSGQTCMELYPRIVQPNRLSFRFLAADNNEQEMNSHPATTPICGWILINNVNGGLMFYDGDGTPIGTLEQGQSEKGEDTVVWQSAPSIYPFGTSLDDAFGGKNVQLYNFAKSILSNTSTTYLANLIKVIDKTLTHIVPKNTVFANSVLISRPLALVQASLSLELQGLPAVNESWDALTQDINQYNTTGNALNRTNDNFTQVQFPTKLGDHDDFNDGLVGYFTADNKEVSYNSFYSTLNPQEIQPPVAQDTNIINGHKIPLTPSSYNNKTSQKIAMLIDPTASINAITGILPTKEIYIPEDQYLPALKSIYITFLTAPIVSTMEDDKVFLPTSQEKGAYWSWIQAQASTEGNEVTQWLEKSVLTEHKIFGSTKEIIEGWIKLNSN